MSTIHDLSGKQVCHDLHENYHKFLLRDAINGRKEMNKETVRKFDQALRVKRLQLHISIVKN
jgi:hypothetical protein